MPTSLPGSMPVSRPDALPALLVSGERSGCGKTTLTLALMAAFARRDLAVQGFKTGPDFIDTAWHSAVTGRPSLNLDPWMHGYPDAPPAISPVTPPAAGHASIASPLHAQFSRGAHAADLAIIEGAMGLFDGLPHVPASSADVACLLDVPVLLALDCRGCAATAAAVAHGLAHFRPHLPLLGLLPRDTSLTLPSRHLGLFSATEAMTSTLMDALAFAAEKHLALDTILSLAQRAAVSVSRPSTSPISPPSPSGSSLRVAIARDEAFSFWYAEHDALLVEAGVQLVPFSPLRDGGLPPDIHGLILPGGYPELHARALSANVSMREVVRHFSGLIYAECGGYLYLMESLECDGALIPLCGALPLKARMETQRAALGYREVLGLAGPWANLTLRGHEFHYSRIIERPDVIPPLWRSHAPSISTSSEEGVALGNIFASYLHISLLSQPSAARRLADACRSCHPANSGNLT